MFLQKPDYVAANLALNVLFAMSTTATRAGNKAADYLVGKSGEEYTIAFMSHRIATVYLNTASTEKEAANDFMKDVFRNSNLAITIIKGANKWAEGLEKTFGESSLEPLMDNPDINADVCASLKKFGATALAATVEKFSGNSTGPAPQSL